MKFEFRLTLKDLQEAIKIRNQKILMICDESIGVSILFVLLRFAQIVIMNVNAPVINIFITKIVPHIIECSSLQVEEKHVLAISDSSEVNLQSHVGRLKLEDLGVVGNNKDVGFLFIRH